MSWYDYSPYVSVAERRRKAQSAAKRLAKKSGRILAPVTLATKKIATTFWGKAWCDNLEAYSDFASRLPRGRSYLRNGSVIDLQIAVGKVEALVQGSALYQIEISFRPLAPQRWREFKAHTAGKVTNLLDLLQGRLSKEILAEITTKRTGLFPSPTEIGLKCSCPDWADMCKHIAAVLYGVGARLDETPELFFALRGVEMAELISAASGLAGAPAAGVAGLVGLEEDSLSELFGVEIEAAAPANVKKPPVPAKKKTPVVKQTKVSAKAKAKTKRKVSRLG
jgi:uncharacterized Zn finger protein